MTRRRALLLPLAAALPARAAVRKTPPLCILSTALKGIWNAEMGEIVKQLGFDGVEITVMPGGLVEPPLAPVDEVRALESLHGADLETPIITTGLANPFDSWCRTVLALAGRTGVGLFKSALDQRNAGPQTQREAYGLSMIGHEYKIEFTVVAGCGGSAYGLAAARRIVAGLDPAWSGIALQSDCLALSDDQIREALPVVKAVSVTDTSADLSRLFKLLAREGFMGPVTVERKSRAEPETLARDAERVRKQIQAAYGAVASAT